MKYFLQDFDHTIDLRSGRNISHCDEGKNCQQRSGRDKNRRSDRHTGDRSPFLIKLLRIFLNSIIKLVYNKKYPSTCKKKKKKMLFILILCRFDRPKTRNLAE